MTPSDFSETVASFQQTLQRLTEDPIHRTAINYGKKLQLTRNGEKVTVCLYNGKKGLKLVWGGKASSFLTECQEAIGEAETKHTSISLLEQAAGFDGLWVGSDESGKGDYFGPLVVAAVCLDNATGKKLYQDGVMDSKALSDKKIRELAQEIRKSAKSFSILALKEPFYNQRYAQLQSQKMNLNHLLASGHVHALDAVLQKVPTCHWAVVDQFSRHSSIAAQLLARHPGLHVYETPGGERDMAVAAASILARDTFVSIMDALSAKAGFPLPKGGGAQATAAAKRVVKEQGREALEQYVKLHFANTKSL